MFHSRSIQIAVMVAVIATPLFLFGDRALAIQDSEDKVWFGPVAVGFGQGARVNVYAIGSAPAGVLVTPWTFRVRIFNARGILVQEREFQAAPGVTRSLEVSVQDSEDFPADRLGRRTMRAEIVGFNPQPDPPGKFATTMEVYSLLSGHTSLFIGNPDILPLAQIVTPPGSN
jgi:hypothetical protein